jgi:hypothetical protein
VSEAKSPADDAAIAKECADVFGARARCDVVVLRLAGEEQVANAPPYEIGLEPATLELANDARRVFVDRFLWNFHRVPNEAGRGVRVGWATGDRSARRSGGPLVVDRKLTFDRKGGQIGALGEIFVGTAHTVQSDAHSRPAKRTRVPLSKQCQLRPRHPRRPRCKW